MTFCRASHVKTKGGGEEIVQTAWTCGGEIHNYGTNDGNCSPQLSSRRCCNWEIYNSMCMAPIKRKSNTTIDSFWNGQMAEPKIHANIQRFLQLHVPEDMGLSLQYTFDVGFVKTCKDNVSAVSPDGMSAVSFDPKTSRESVLDDLTKLRKLVNDGQMPFTVRKNAKCEMLMVGHEYKH